MVQLRVEEGISVYESSGTAFSLSQAMPIILYASFPREELAMDRARERVGRREFLPRWG